MEGRGDITLTYILYKRGWKDMHESGLNNPQKPSRYNKTVKTRHTVL